MFKQISKIATYCLKDQSSSTATREDLTHQTSYSPQTLSITHRIKQVNVGLKHDSSVILSAT